MLANVKTRHRVEGAGLKQFVVLIAEFDWRGQSYIRAAEAPRHDKAGAERSFDDSYHDALGRLIVKVVDVVTGSEG